MSCATALTEDVLSEDKGECVICLEDLLQGDTIARLPCLCIYHKAWVACPQSNNRSKPVCYCKWCAFADVLNSGLRRIARVRSIPTTEHRLPASRSLLSHKSACIPQDSCNEPRVWSFLHSASERLGLVIFLFCVVCRLRVVFSLLIPRMFDHGLQIQYYLDCMKPEAVVFLTILFSGKISGNIKTSCWRKLGKQNLNVVWILMTFVVDSTVLCHCVYKLCYSVWFYAT